MGCFSLSLQGQLSERKVLAATRNSDLFKEQPSTCVELESVPACGKNGPSEEKTRKRREESQNNGNTVRQRSKTDPIVYCMSFEY